MSDLLDWSLILTISVMVVGALVGSYMRTSRKDRCLQDFDGFHVTLEKQNRRVVWGRMGLYPTGFELVYRSDVQDEKHLETSYVLYQDEYADIQAIYRYAHDLSPEGSRLREQSLRRSFHPGLPRRLLRSLRNFMSTATDSLGDAVGLMIGRVRKPAAHLLTETSEAYLKDIGKNIIGYAGTGYDPLLERYVGTRVVVEVVEENAIHEHVGILKEYSANFLEVLDVYYPLPQVVALKSGTQQEISEQVNVAVDGRQIRVQNGGDQPVFVERVTVGDQDKDLRAIVPPGEEITLHLNNVHLELVVHLRVACLLDMIVPRSHALVRHQAERYDPDTIFDVGLSLVKRDGDRREIERLEQVLRYSPHDAVSASKLGELLFHRGEIEEAQARFKQALVHSRRLPDNGARVAQNLRLVERRLRDLKRPPQQTAGSTDDGIDQPASEH